MTIILTRCFRLWSSLLTQTTVLLIILFFPLLFSFSMLGMFWENRMQKCSDGGLLQLGLSRVLATKNILKITLCGARYVILGNVHLYDGYMNYDLFFSSPCSLFLMTSCNHSLLFQGFSYAISVLSPRCIYIYSFSRHFIQSSLQMRIIKKNNSFKLWCLAKSSPRVQCYGPLSI